MYLSLGMGELHLEIIKDRILKEYKIDVDLGPFQIAYREAPIQKATDTLTVETTIGTTKQFASLHMSVIPLDEKRIKQEEFKLDRSPEFAGELSAVFPKHIAAIKRGVQVALANGPKLGCPVSFRETNVII